MPESAHSSLKRVAAKPQGQDRAPAVVDGQETELDLAIGRFRGVMSELRAVTGDVRSAPAPAAVSHQPRKDRTRTWLRGKVVFGLGARSLDCAIRDLSQTGAKIRLGGAEALPQRVWLLHISQGLAFEARVAWMRGADIGLAFSQARNLSEDRSPEFKALRQLWLECLPR